jgi:hypothetical protein
VEKAIREMRDKTATGANDVSGDVLKLLGENRLKLTTQLISSIYINEQWPRNFIEATIALKKKPKPTKCSDQCTISLNAHTAKILRRRIKRKIEDVPAEDQFGFR